MYERDKGDEMVAETQRPVRVVVVDDDPLVRTGIRLLLRGSVGLVVAGELSGPRGLTEALTELRADVLLMDVVMREESGLSVARRVRLMYPSLRIVLMSSLQGEAIHQDARNVGADMYIPKTAPAAEIIAALTGASASAARATTILTNREIEITERLAAGESNDEIAAALHLSSNTVKTYVSRSMDKTGTANRVQLANWFHETTAPNLLSGE